MHTEKAKSAFFSVHFFKKERKGKNENNNEKTKSKKAGKKNI